MNSRWFVRVLLMTCWVPVVLIAAAICYETLAITGKTTRYVAVGKVVMQPLSRDSQIDTDDKVGEEFGNTQIEIFEGNDLRRRALERVRGLYPQLKEVGVETNVTRARGSNILKVASVSEEQKYTRVYLDALLDEYMAFRQEMSDKSLGTAMNKIIEDVLSREKQVRQDSETLEAFLREYDELLLTTEHERLAKSVSRQRGEVEDLARAGGGEEKLKAARDALAESERKLDVASQVSATLVKLKEKRQRDLEDYQLWKKTLDGLENTLRLQGNYVAIMERPSVAVMENPDFAKPLALAALVGASAGLVLIFLASILVGIAKSGVP